MNFEKRSVVGESMKNSIVSPPLTCCICINVAVSGSLELKEMTSMDDEAVRRKRARNRWFKAVTLVNNPILVFERLLKRYQKEKEQAGVGEDERFKLKVITGWKKYVNDSKRRMKKSNIASLQFVVNSCSTLDRKLI